ncbi:unnamed protein product [Gongylonema pulchrum]|uniref:Ovule protein n=1 Tax=Gongylonema pulchrum TaxID=637853 RepID=A0A183D489_9BILA|nr:unnamed protein product [Gongylonema pulchrum]
MLIGGGYSNFGSLDFDKTNLFSVSLILLERPPRLHYIVALFRSNIAGSWYCHENRDVSVEVNILLHLKS